MGHILLRLDNWTNKIIVGLDLTNQQLAQHQRVGMRDFAHRSPYNLMVILCQATEKLPCFIRGYSSGSN